MTTQVGTNALDTLDQAGLCVHVQAGDHHHIGKRDRVTVRIDVSIGDPHGRTLALSAAGGISIRQLPISAFSANAMIAELFESGALRCSEQVYSVLEHLLLDVASTAEELDLRTLVLDPVAAGEGGYCIDAAALTRHHSPARTTEVS